MNRKARIERRLVWLSLPCLLWSSCSTTSISTEDLDLSRSVPAQTIPLSVGLCLDDSVTKLGDVKNCAMRAVVTGEVVSDLVEQASRNMFSDVILLANAEESQRLSREKIDAVVSVKLIRLTDNCGTPMRSSGSKFLPLGLLGPFLSLVKPFHRSASAGKVQVVMRWNIDSLDEKPIYFSQVRGEGRAWVPVPAELSSKEWKQAYLAGLRDQFEKAQKDIVSSGWWKDPSWRER